MKKPILLLMFSIVLIVTGCQTLDSLVSYELPELPTRPALPTASPLTYSDLHEAFVLLSVYSLTLENWAKEVSALVSTEKPKKNLKADKK